MANETTFENAKLGDKVYTLGLGWGHIHLKAHLNTPTPLIQGRFGNTFVWFTTGGKQLAFDSDGSLIHTSQTQVLFWDEVKIIAPVKPKVAPPVDTLLNIWSSPLQKWKRYSTGKFALNGRLLVFNDGATSKSATNLDKVFEVDNWEVVV